MRIEARREEFASFEAASAREWILTNGIGGFAMGSLSGANTRRYHGLLCAAIHPPEDRMVLLDNVEAVLSVKGGEIALSSNEYSGAVFPDGWSRISSFAVGEHAEWIFEQDGVRIRKRVGLHPGRNAVTVDFTLLAGPPCTLALRPLVCQKPYHSNFAADEQYPKTLKLTAEGMRIRHGGVALNMAFPGATAVETAGWYFRFLRRREAERGLPESDDLFCPAELSWPLAPGDTATLTAWEGSEAPEPFAFGDLAPHADPLDDLRSAAAQFIVSGAGRTTILAGYPWFTDWGRDTMIALPGICLATGRIAEARSIIRDMLRHTHRGLIPNRFEEGGGASYNTVDATLWMAHAIHQTLLAEWDDAFAAEAAAGLAECMEWHMKGTDFGIGVDPEDGLLRQGGQGLQLTWMDAKIEDWVVTPRHGKPVEINGLWVNFLRVAEWLMDRLGQDGLSVRLAAEKAEASFNAKFWREAAGWYLDTAEPDDASLRPNQIIAMGLPFSPMKGPEADRALEACLAALWTPRGLRTLSPRNAHYRGRFEGDMRSRDSAYHQGTVWPWLTGSLVRAVLRVRGDRSLAQSLLQVQMSAFGEQGLGGVAEVYDGDSPHRPGGCPWQAWSVGELLSAAASIGPAAKE